MVTWLHHDPADPKIATSSTDSVTLGSYGPTELIMCRSSAYTRSVSKQSMQEPTFLILTALAAGAQHGYGIMTDVARISDGRVRLRAGTLYAALDRLNADGL